MRARMLAAHNRDVTLAWHVAAITLTAYGKKKMPKLKDLLARPSSRKEGPPSPMQMRVQLEMLAAHLGKSLRPVRRKTASTD
jgi:hypothetical protein